MEGGQRSFPRIDTRGSGVCLLKAPRSMLVARLAPVSRPVSRCYGPLAAKLEAVVVAISCAVSYSRRFGRSLGGAAASLSAAELSSPEILGPSRRPAAPPAAAGLSRH